jgi:hypothetical protein
MSMIITGTVKQGGVFDVKGKDGSVKPMISFTLVDGMGNTYPCQMWPDDPGFAALSSVIADYRRHQVQLSIAGYTVRMRTFKDNSVKPWANFIVCDVTTPTAASQLAMSFSGTVKAGKVNRPTDASKKPMLWFTAVDDLGTTFSCQMWPDDPKFNEVAAILDGDVRRAAVQFLVSYYTLKERVMPDGSKNPQINFVVSDVLFPTLATR